MFEKIDENMLLLSPGFLKQKEYWLNKLSGGMGKTELILPGKKIHDRGKEKKTIEMVVPDHISKQLLKLAKQSDLSLYIILLAAVKIWKLVLYPLIFPSSTGRKSKNRVRSRVLKFSRSPRWSERIFRNMYSTFDVLPLRPGP